MSNSTRAALIAAGVRNLKEFGYPDVSATNILTDRVYSVFFDNMLSENLGRGHDTEIKALRAAIAKATA